MDPNDLNSATWPAQLTKVVRREMYDTLQPSKPELSAEGKNVLITGVSGGIARVRLLILMEGCLICC